MKELETQIIRGLKSGIESSYNQLFKEYYVILSVFATRYVSDMEIAKEIVQDFFVHLFEIRESIHIKTSLKSFLFQSIRNRCLNHIKQSQLHEKHLENLNADSKFSTDFEDKMKAAELEYQIFQVVNTLPNQCRKIFKMSRIEGKRNKEIATTLNISKRTVETQISKALKVLRKSLRGFLQLLF